MPCKKVLEAAWNELEGKAAINPDLQLMNTTEGMYDVEDMSNEIPPLP